jgi:RNA polymerase sigma-54 factor
VAVGPSLSQRLDIKQVLTLQQQLALKLLAVSIVELHEKAETEVTENPNLEYAEEADAQVPALIKPSSPEGSNTPEAETPVGPAVELPADRLDNLSSDWREYFRDRPNDRHDTEPLGGDASHSPEERLSKTATLEEYLLWQLRLSRITEKESLIGVYIIGNLDERGYLASTVEEISAATESSIDEVECVLKRILLFDPVGVAARDLRECLLAQLESHGFADTLAARIVSDHLGGLESKKYEKLARALAVSVDEIAEAAREIAALEPKPSRAYAAEEARHVIPEIFVEKNAEDYVISLNEDGLPKLRLSGLYDRMARQEGEAAAQARQYLKEKLAAARWFLDAIEQRQRTMRKVAQSIFTFQRDFLERGPNHVRPMVLRDVAADIGMHESTVSRATSNKWVSTPHGVFELKWFFQGGIAAAGGAVASESVRSKIREIIGQEDKLSPYSDAAIAALLSAGSTIKMARRTVTKYRESMGILSSTKRRKPHSQ